MDRREALKSIVSAISVGAFATGAEAVERRYPAAVTHFGALQPSFAQKQRAARRRKSQFYERFTPLKGISKETGDTFLWKFLEDELKVDSLPPYYQGEAEDGSEGEGDCVGQSSGRGCDILAASDIHLLGQHERFVAEASVEMNYAGGRVEIGNLGINDDDKWGLKGRGGSHSEWQVRWLKEYGVLHRLEYRDGDEYIDLRGYHPARSRKYRDVGVPDWLEPIAKKHPVEEYTQVKSAEEALDAVAAGQPVIICSSYAIKNARDDEGFSEPYIAPEWLWGQNRFGRFFRYWGRRKWFHAMILVGVIRSGKKQGGVILNSHGVWNSGPQPHGIPDGGFAIETKYLDMMIKDWLDCYAMSSYKGHEAKRIRRKIKLF